MAHLRSSTTAPSSPAANFAQLFTQVSLVFASVDETTEVPELRWLPKNKAATFAARELVQGPSDWLAPAVHTGFPANSALAVDSVVVTDGVAAVQLTSDSAGNAAQRSLAQEQMELTLTSLPGVTSVNVTVGGAPLGGDDSANLTAPPVAERSSRRPSSTAGLACGTGRSCGRCRNPLAAFPRVPRGVAQSFDKPTAAWIVNGTDLVTLHGARGRHFVAQGRAEQGRGANVHDDDHDHLPGLTPHRALC